MAAGPLGKSAGPPSHGAGSGLVSLIAIIFVLLVAVGLVVWLMWGRRNPRRRQAPCSRTAVHGR